MIVGLWDRGFGNFEGSSLTTVSVVVGIEISRTVGLILSPTEWAEGWNKRPVWPVVHRSYCLSIWYFSSVLFFISKTGTRPASTQTAYIGGCNFSQRPGYGNGSETIDCYVSIGQKSVRGKSQIGIGRAILPIGNTVWSIQRTLILSECFRILWYESIIIRSDSEFDGVEL